MTESDGTSLLRIHPLVVGIDPGLTGAWALVCGRQLLDAGDLPVIGDGSEKTIDGAQLNALMSALSPMVVVVEKAWPRPKDGSMGSFRFGRSYGVVEGVVLGRGVELVRVTPQKWKKAFGLIGKSDTGEPSRQAVTERWPQQAPKFFARKKDHNRAEAALIALWYALGDGIAWSEAA